uniref:Uncharacterized protein n=1 Tax=viral metagenome TaxID=1070528 RepID=A0A6C0KIP5_9ZZZZ
MDEQTIWNKELFSNKQPEKMKEDDNFQTMNMIYKIKNIKKSKKPKPENYKKIEAFDTILVNEPIIEGAKNKSDIGKKKSDVAVDDPNFLGLPDKDYDGVDTPDKGVSDDPRKQLKAGVDQIFKKIDKFNYEKAKFVSIAFSGSKNPSENDVNIVKKYIAWFETILFSYFACYNWFFLMYYRYNNEDAPIATAPESAKEAFKKDKYGYRVFGQRIDTYWIQNASIDRKNPLAIFYKVIDYFFIFSIMFVEQLQNILLDKFPQITRGIFNLKGCFVILFLLLIVFNQYATNMVYNFFTAILSGKTTNILVGVMYFGLIIAYFFGTYNFGFIEKTPGFTFHSYADYVFGIPYTWITGFMRFVMLMLISVPIGGLLCVFYILYQSFCGIFANVDYLEPFGYFLGKEHNSFSKINDYIKNNNSKYDDNMFKKAFNLIFDYYLYKYILNLVFIVMFIFALIDYNKNLQSYNLKISLNCITIVLIIMFFVGTLGFFSDIKNPEQPEPLDEEKEKDEMGFFDYLMSFIKELADDVVKPLLGEMPGMPVAPGAPGMPGASGVNQSSEILPPGITEQDVNKVKEIQSKWNK